MCNTLTLGSTVHPSHHISVLRRRPQCRRAYRIIGNGGGHAEIRWRLRSSVIRMSLSNLLGNTRPGRSAVHQAHPGSAVTLTGPDLVRIQLQTDEGPSGEDE